MRRTRGRPYSRSGLPVICGVKLPDGRRCMARVEPCGRCKGHADLSCCPKMPADMTPDNFELWYRTWLEEQGREPILPQPTGEFLGWWRWFPTTPYGEAPFSMDLYQVRAWWLVWCGLAGRERLLPFDLTRFCEHWRAS